MIQKAARSSRSETFREETISFNKIPNQSKLFTDFQIDSKNLRKFYPEKETPLVNYAEQVLSKYKIDRAALCDFLTETNESFGAGVKTFENIELLREKDCTTIVTGQQAGLFSGALYTIYKALSAVKLAEELREKNLKTVPVFWIAEEDHDFDEVKKTYNLNKQGKLIESENTPVNRLINRPVGLIEFDQTINETIEDLFENLPHTEFTDEIKKIAVETYQSGETFSRSFAKFITKLFADYGLIILAPLNEKLKKLSAPIFEEAVEKSDVIVSALLERNKELERESYQPQVMVMENSFPFFYQNETGERQSLRKNARNSKFAAQNSKNEYEKSELLEIARNSPQNLSPNALMRPVVQDYLLPTLVYFGGSAEIAYFAQNSAIYEVLNRPVTPIRLRANLTIVERKHDRTLEKYQLKFANLFDGKEKLSMRVVEKFLNQGAARTFTEIEDIFNAELNRLEGELKNIEPTLAANLDTRRRKILWHFGALRKKYHRAEIIKNETVERRIENLFAAILPHDALQERTLNVITFLNLFGENFIDWIYETIDTDERNHQILYL
jgi:bacillithiol biosynthesis cysteine-adding enzyme BshC